VRRALVLGGASTVWADVEAALELGQFDGAVGCNDAAAAWPGKLDALVTLHGDKAPLWIERRARAGLAPPAAVYGHTDARPGRKAPALTHTTEFRFPGQTDTGSSGLFALKVALVDLGYDRAVLCGVPMQPAGQHFFDARDWRGAYAHRDGWKQALPAIKDRARSMSGWTAELLGRAEAAWLA
jgi:hypothetical protein